MKRYIVDNLIFSGSHVISKRGLQDHGRPILDSLVREAIQNSLDAASNDCTDGFVEVDFDTKDFEISRLTQHLEGLECINNRPNIPNRYLAIRDKNTKGLTGNFFDEKSNLKKLVASYMQNQEQSGAGGSCGQGKTLYFRLGLGLVLFYSRILVGPGKYESLIYAVLIQDPDPTSKKTIFPNINGSNPKGIVVWGKPIEGRHGEVQETRDEATINNILEALNYSPFSGEETGTAVIIPFINEEKLLNSNREQDDSRPYWQNDINDYIRVAVQRWYSARLNNLMYPKFFYGNKWLKVRINGELLNSDYEKNFCKVLRHLYNKASSANVGKQDSIYSDYPFEDYVTEVKEIRMNNIDDNVIGHLAYTIIPRSDLDSDYNTFYSYIDINAEHGTPIVTYCRKPGMNISYEKTEPWVPNIKLAEDDYLIAYFVLKSSAKVKVARNLTIEDYIRDGEQATHDNWYDIEIQEEYGPTKQCKQSFVRILSGKIKDEIKEAISPSLASTAQRKKIDGLGDLFGKVFLKNFLNSKSGRAVDASKKNILGSKRSKSAKNVSQNIHVSYSTDGDVIIDITLKTSKQRKSRGCDVEFNILSASGKLSFDQWHKEVDSPLPFKLVSIDYNLTKIDDLKTNDNDLLNINKLYSSANCLYGISLRFVDNESHSYECMLKFMLEVEAK